MIAAAWPGRSSGPTVSGSCVIQAPTFVPSTSPVATARRTSRSVRIPERSSPFITSAAPTPRACICAAASVKVAVASTVSGAGDITSRTITRPTLGQAPPPAQVGASPDRLGAGRGKPAEQLDVVRLVVAAGRASTELVASPTAELEARQQPLGRDGELLG